MWTVTGLLASASASATATVNVARLVDRADLSLLNNVGQG
jgi:hypothetical protein